MRKVFLFLLPLFLAVNASAQLSGTYTISNNSSDNANYSSFGAAVSALSAGVSGEVIFQVAPGTYEEYVTVSAISGASASNRVIFRGMGDDNQQVVVTSNAGYTTNSTLTLDGSDYVTFENMTLQTTSENRANVVTLRGGLTNDRFENVRFVGAVSETSNTDNDKNVVYRISGSWLDVDNAFVGCEFLNGFIGLYYQGQSMDQYNDGLLVENCTFSNQCSKAIYATFTEDVVLRGNTINNTTNDNKTDYNAIDIFRCINACVFENNVMNVTRPTKYTTVFKVRPCTGTSSEHVIIRNNIVNLHSDASSASYCYAFDNADCDYIYFAHNTAKCSGSGPCSNLFVQKGNWSNLFVYNNLFVNTTSGYVFRYTHNVDGRQCDYNRIQFAGDYVGLMAGEDYATLSDWNAATGYDAHTALCTPDFVGDNDLHIVSATGLTVSHPLVYVTKDIDDENRSSTTPCAGADEFVAGSDLPPVVQNAVQDITFNAFPASQTINLTNTFNDPDDPNENIVITVQSNSNPSLVSTALNGRNLTVTRLNATGGVATITLRATSDGQYVETSFSVQCVAEDQPPVVVEPLDPIVFTAFPQSFSFDISEVFDDPDNSNYMMEYTVEDYPDEISAEIDDEDMLTVTRTSPSAFSGTLTIRATSNGKHVDMDVAVSGSQVTIEIGTATFEDVTLSANGVWSPAEGENLMLSGGWVFTNYYSPYFWGGFTASNHTDITQTGLNAQYTSAMGGGHESTQYAVAYAMGAQTEVSAADGSEQTVSGCYVTNNLWAYQNVLDGDNTATPFGGTSGTDPDWFKLTATGKNANGQTVGTLDFYLADYRFDNSEDDYVLNTWEWFDLTPLGPVASISFSLSSTKNNSWGMITPAYFCMDDFNGTAPVVAELPTVSAVIMSDITETTAVASSSVTADGGAEVTERGVCWSLTDQPTIADSHLANGTGTGEFSVSMTALNPNTTYYVCAYAINSVGIAYGEVNSFVTMQEAAPGLLGDADLNGQVDINDVLAIMRHSLQIYFLNEEAMQLADVDGNQVVNMNDAVILLRIVLGISK